jgi:centromere/kinetochore protein ZW10
MRKRWNAIQSRLPEGEKLDLNMQADLTISLGKRAFDGQLLLQHKTLLDCLQDADGFTRTYEEIRFNACQRSIKQVELILKQLQAAWRPVLTKSSYLVAMGRLVEGVLKRLLLDIESIEDISEVESEKLASLIKTVGELEYLFREEGQPAEEVSQALPYSNHADPVLPSSQSTVALYVPSWFKASYLSEILTGSLVDIEFLYFEAGALVDYSKAEVVSLIRSLFADTPKRARVIDRIQSS